MIKATKQQTSQEGVELCRYSIFLLQFLRFFLHPTMGHTGWLTPKEVLLRGMGDIMREDSRPRESRMYRGAMPAVPLFEPGQ